MMAKTLAADTLLRGGNVITMTDPHSRGEPLAVAVREGRILALTPEEQAQALIGPSTRIIDITGKTVLPGFVDAHVHFTQAGLGNLGPQAYDVTSREQVLAAASQAARTTAPGEGVLVHGVYLAGLDKRLTRAELDAVDSTRPIMVVEVGAHGCVLNGKAIELVNLPPDTPGIGADGAFTAQANTRARYRFYTRVVSDEARAKAMHRAAAMAAEVGITTVHALEGGSLHDGRGWLPQRDVEVLLREQSRLPIDTVIYFQSTDVQRAVDWSLPRIGGCIWVDGDYDEHTAALLDPYADCPDCSGSLYFTDPELDAFVESAHGAGLQISMHAIGDAAIEQLLNAYERVLKKMPHPDHRHRIEHFSLPTQGHIRKAAALGVALGMQPNFALTSGPLPTRSDPPSGLVAYLGYDRWQRRHPYRQILDAGLLVAGGSDADPRPMGPLIGIQAVAAHPEAERRLTPYEALQLYTVNGARIAFQERDKGTLEAGKKADIVVLGENPLTADPARLAQIAVEWTFSKGQPVYQRGS
jgi:predicted amidohydrolase YtcJ